MTTTDCDVLVIGAGITGLMAAHYLSRECEHIIVATKKDLKSSNSARAQGGISCVQNFESDSFDSHAADTHDAGAGLCDDDVVRRIIEGGPEGIEELERLGVRFARTSPDGPYDLGREGGHTHRRILHAGDITGRAVIEGILSGMADNARIEFRENLMAIDLITTGWLELPGASHCVGAYFLNSEQREGGEISAIRAPIVVLATGGAGKVYLYTSNPDVATGDGIAMAWRVGLPIRNMEFIQFHPTCLFHPEAKSFLISEAVRGEGGVLVNAAGKRFVEKSDTRGSLAPRDIVARAIDDEIKRSGEPSVFLDITHKSEDFLRKRFPNIYSRVLKFGFDMAQQPIPVVPAAHYTCGGVEASVQGETNLPGLYAAGEVTCTGLHGANRLASNSLLEGFVCAKHLANHILNQGLNYDARRIEIPAWQYGDAKPSDEAVVVEHNWNEVRTAMWDYVGIVRTDKRLERAMRRIKNLRREIREYYLDYLITPDVLELRNLIDVAELIVRSALRRKESRGLHYTLDYPELHREARDTIIQDAPGKSSLRRED